VILTNSNVLQTMPTEIVKDNVSLQDFAPQPRLHKAVTRSINGAVSRGKVSIGTEMLNGKTLKKKLLKLKRQLNKKFLSLTNPDKIVYQHNIRSLI
jgi:hypothetical protein